MISHVNGSRTYNCPSCLDSGMISVFHQADMLEICRTGRRLTRLARTMAVACSCGAEKKHEKLIRRGVLVYPSAFKVPLMTVDNARADKWEKILFDFVRNYVGPIMERRQYAGVLFDRQMEPTVRIDGDDWEQWQ